MTQRQIATLETVTAAANAVLQAGGTPSIRNVTGLMRGGSPNHVGPLLKIWRSGQKPSHAAEIAVDHAVAEAIAAQLVRATSDATCNIQADFAIALDDNKLLAEVGRELEQRTTSLQTALDAASAQVQQLRGQLDERSRELQSVRDETAAAVVAAQAKATQERESAEGLRQELVRATLRLEALPRLESQVQDLDQRLAEASKSLAEAGQAAAVAAAKAAAESKRADEAAQREAVAGGQLDKLENELAEARQLERSLREQAQVAAAALATAEGKLAGAQAETSQLERALRDQAQETAAKLATAEGKLDGARGELLQLERTWREQMTMAVTALAKAESRLAAMEATEPSIAAPGVAASNLQTHARHA